MRLGKIMYIQWLAAVFLSVFLGLGQAHAAIVSSINVEGNERVDASTVTAYFPVMVGDNVDDVILNEAVKRLFDTGLFRDVRITQTNGQVRIIIAENPVVSRIYFEGNDALKTEELEAELTLKERTVFTPSRAEADARRILNLYQRSGRYAAKVEPKIIERDQNRVDVVFEVFEGEKTYIENIGFVGNEAFDDGDLRGQILSEEYSFLRSLFSAAAVYDQDRLAVDREKIVQFYRANGFADITVDPAFVRISDNEEAFSIVFTIIEGPQYTFGKFDVVTRLPGVDPEYLKTLIEAEEGDVFSQLVVDDADEHITLIAEERGYAFAEVRSSESKNRETRVIDMTFELLEGRKVFIERIDIIGNVRTRDNVIRREFDIVEGDPFNRTNLRIAQRALERLNYFSKVEVSETAGTAPDKVVVVVKVEEQSTGELSLGAGFSTVDSYVASVGLKERNLLGTGRTLDASFSIGSTSTQIDVGLIEPYLLGRDVSGSLDVFIIEEDFEDESSYESSDTGFTLGMGFNLAEFNRLKLSYTLKQEEITDVPSTASLSIQESEGEFLISTLSATHTHARDFIRFGPEAGYSISSTIDWYGVGGDVTYVQTRLKASGNYEIFDDVNAKIVGEVGHIFTYGGYDSRINDRFQLGGFQLRGFERAGIGPRDSVSDDSLGGEKYTVVRSEVDFPLGLGEDFGFRGAAYADAGTVWGVGERGSTTNVVGDEAKMRAAVGVGLIWTSPFGPLRFNLSYPVLEESFDKTETFQFSAGTRF